MASLGNGTMDEHLAPQSDVVLCHRRHQLRESDYHENRRFAWHVLYELAFCLRTKISLGKNSI